MQLINNHAETRIMFNKLNQYYINIIYVKHDGFLLFTLGSLYWMYLYIPITIGVIKNCNLQVQNI